jgi:hypothetical protein
LPSGIGSMYESSIARCCSNSIDERTSVGFGRAGLSSSPDDTKQVCQVGTPSAECCGKSKFSPRGNSGFILNSQGNSRKSAARSSSSNLQNNSSFLCPQLHRVVVKHKV